MQTKDVNAAAVAVPKRKFRRVHQAKCGEKERIEYDNYEDVRIACERRLAQWAREGVLLYHASDRPNNWLFS